jgi:hypothetical protein
MRQTLFNRLPRQNFEIGAVTTDASKTVGFYNRPTVTTAFAFGI